MANYLLKGVYPFRYQSKVVGFDIWSAKTHQIHPPKIKINGWSSPENKTLEPEVSDGVQVRNLLFPQVHFQVPCSFWGVYFMTTLASKANSFGWTPCQGCQLTGSDLGETCEKKIKNIPKNQGCLGFCWNWYCFTSFSCRNVCSPLFGMNDSSINQ